MARGAHRALYQLKFIYDTKCDGRHLYCLNELDEII